MKEKKSMILPEFSLEGKVFAVTGCMGLIGKGVAEAFAEAGANLLLADITKTTQISDFASNIEKKFGSQVVGFETNITNRKSVSSLIDLGLKTFNKIDGVIHLAAIDAKFETKNEFHNTAFENFPMEIWEKSVDVNINGTFIVLQEFIKTLLEQNFGNIITVASTYSLVAPNQSLYVEEDGTKQFKPVDYVATKSIIPNLTRYLATFYGNRGIRCNCIVPHGIENSHSQEFKNRFANFSPLGRMCKLREIVLPCVFLASEGSSYMTGSTMVVDGGWTAW